MSLEETIQSFIEGVVVSIPQIIFVLFSVIYYLKQVKKETEKFPLTAEETKNTVENNISKNHVQIVSSLKNTKDEIYSLVHDFTLQLKKEVKEEMTFMKEELKKYRKTLTNSCDFSQILSKENQVFMNIILELITKDPELVKDDIVKKVSEEIANGKFNLREYKDIMINSTVSLEASLKRVLMEVGENAIKEMLVNIGYEKEE